LCNIDIAQIDHFEQMNKLVNGRKEYEIKGETGSIVCLKNSDVAFHTKRIVSEIFVTLDNCLDVLWQCTEMIYSWDPPFEETTGKNTKIKVISSSKAKLQLRQFVTDKLQAHRDFRDALNYIRNKFTHSDYSVRNDVRTHVIEDGYENLNYEGRAIFTFEDDKAKLNDKIPETDREYVAFSTQCSNLVFKIFDEFLGSLQQDLASCRGIPIRCDLS
jgi:hypothetical protein